MENVYLVSQTKVNSVYLCAMYQCGVWTFFPCFFYLFCRDKREEKYVPNQYRFKYLYIIFRERACRVNLLKYTQRERKNIILFVVFFFCVKCVLYEHNRCISGVFVVQLYSIFVNDGAAAAVVVVVKQPYTEIYYIFKYTKYNTIRRGEK